MGPLGSRFLAWLLGAYLLSLGALGSIGLGASRLWVATPREVHRSAAFELDLAPGWSCERDGKEEVCFPAGNKPHRAIAVIADKPRNEADNLDVYEKHLQKPQSVPHPQTKQMVEGKVLRTGRVRIGAREWVESVHYGSEIFGFTTYYLATRTSHVGMLVTFSVFKDDEARYTPQFLEMIKSLRTYQR